MAHSQMDLVLAAMDDMALRAVHRELEAQVFRGNKAGYERDRAVSQYLATVVELEIRRINYEAGSSVDDSPDD